jgi:Zn finger protein HypA/HybF involved in hydrogenase expression
MFKENGRVKPTEKKENANLFSKTFNCYTCGEVSNDRGTSFGEGKICPKCGSVMEEVINFYG